MLIRWRATFSSAVMALLLGTETDDGICYPRRLGVQACIWLSPLGRASFRCSFNGSGKFRQGRKDSKQGFAQTSDAVAPIFVDQVKRLSLARGLRLPVQ